MRLRAQLVIAFTLLLLIVVAALGTIVVRSSRTVLVNQVDESLDGIQIRTGPDRTPPLQPLDRQMDLSERAISHVVIGPDGRVLFEDASGFFDDPDPLPDALGLIEEYEALEIVTIESVDGSMRYRAFYYTNFDGVTEVWAASLEETDAAVNRMLGTILLAGAGIALVGATITWWLVRRGLKPVDEMVDTATAIAGGDLSRRVPEAAPATELGQLGMALNEMLGQIETAFEHEAEAQDRLKVFVADASHELRTPIAAVQGYAELYRQGALDDDEKLDNAMRRVGSDAARMQRLVTDLLLLARLDRGEHIEHRPVRIGALAQDAATDSAAIDPDRTINVEGDEKLKVMGDDHQLGQVISNLLANARTHTPPGTPVSVRFRGDGAQAVIDVIDDGPGVPAGSEKKLFDRFYRVDPSRARKSGGSGLGLAIVAAIVADHGGSVEAANEPGRGARFTVRLPLANA